SCPNGIAHTYMAQEKLEQVAKEMGVDIKVETQGGVGADNVFTSQEIDEAVGVIIAADKLVDLWRFVGKRLIIENVREGIHNQRGLIQRIINQDAPIYQSEPNYHSKDPGKSKCGIQ
ncbi:PTS fructose transporter subunit IIB, partial [Staphylococcus aureus]|uniref:PTS fructose transporter subunit IIB n=1 Tax=Staphylococcus aureus TaxID=1280 RepID=UPI000B26550D